MKFQLKIQFKNIIYSWNNINLLITFWDKYIKDEGVYSLSEVFNEEPCYIVDYQKYQIVYLIIFYIILFKIHDSMKYLENYNSNARSEFKDLSILGIFI